MMVINNVFELGESVFLKTDKEQVERIVTGFLVNPNGLSYRVAAGTSETWHFDIELTRERNIVTVTTN